MNRMNSRVFRKTGPVSIPLAAVLSGFLSLAMTHCSATKDGPGRGPDPLATETGFCNAWATNACNPTVVDDCQAPSVDACIAAQEAFCKSKLPGGYQSDNAQACLDRVKVAYDDAELSIEDIRVVLQFGDPCDKLIRGSTPEGGACTVDTECDTLDGQKCVMKPGQTIGACHEPVVVGGGLRCDAPEETCEEGFYCNGTNCVEPAGPDDPCNADAECGADLRCILDAADDAGVPTGTCQPRAVLSAECTADNECQSGYCSIAPGETGLCADMVSFGLREPVCEDLK
jgi:hypothetical protein